MGKFSTLRIALSATLFFGIGCISPKSYVDPTLPKIESSAINRNEPKSIILEVQFFRAGKRLPKVDAEVREKVRTQLLASGAVKEILASPDPSKLFLKIDMDNVADTGSAVAKGIGTGLTFGLAGNMVTDGYVFTATFQRPNSPEIKKIYKHTIHTTIGNHKGPEGLEPMTLALAFDKVLEGLVLNLVKDLQAGGSL